MFKKKSYLLTALSFIFLSGTALAQTTSGSSTSPEQAMLDQGCDPALAQQMSNAKEAQINGREALARQILKNEMGNMDYNTASCLGNLLGLSPHLSLPTLGSLENQFDQFVCSQVQSYSSPYISNIQQGIGQFTNKVNGYFYQNISLGSVGGLNLGTVPMGMNLYSGASGGSSYNLADSFRQSYKDHVGVDPTEPPSTSIEIQQINDTLNNAQNYINGYQ